MSGRDPQHEQTQWGGGSNSGWVVFSLAIAAIPVFGTMAMITRVLGAAAIPIWAIVAVGAAMIFRGPVGQALGRSIGGQVQEGPTEIPSELYAELDELRARVAELEERVDFSERLLTKQNGRES